MYMFYICSIILKNSSLNFMEQWAQWEVTGGFNRVKKSPYACPLTTGTLTCLRRSQARRKGRNEDTRTEGIRARRKDSGLSWVLAEAPGGQSFRVELYRKDLTKGKVLLPEWLLHPHFVSSPLSHGSQHSFPLSLPKNRPL